MSWDEPNDSEYIVQNMGEWGKDICEKLDRIIAMLQGAQVVPSPPFDATDETPVITKRSGKTFEEFIQSLDKNELGKLAICLKMSGDKDELEQVIDEMKGRK